MKIKNNNGPSTDPCGTPLITHRQTEQTPSTQTRQASYRVF